MNGRCTRARNAQVRTFFAGVAVLWGMLPARGQTVPAGWSHATWNVTVEGTDLMNPWVGGLTAPQWSPIDADLDGDADLFAFDRDGSRVLVFERNADSLTLRWDWCLGWPEMRDWCLLRDYNCDGKPDIFTSHQNGIRVHTNVTTPGSGPAFDPTPIDLVALFDFGTGESALPVICLGMDLPAIHDNDGDGDLDIITFTETATTLYRFQGQTPCGLDLVCTNRCYGMLAEASENNALFIGDDFECSFNVIDPRSGVHAGGAITALQLEPSGPNDLIISDVTYPEALGVVLVDGANGLDSAVAVDPEFPANLYGDQALHLPRFPAAYHLDVDQDGVRDLLFSPNTPLETDDDHGVHYFRNTGSDDVPAWSFVQTNYLQDGMVDVGRGAYPLLVDLDDDGLTDLVVANKERYEGVDQTPAAIATYRNVGTVDNPSFEFVEGNAVPLSDFQIESPYPALGDLDGDGDLDLLVGDELGLLHRFNNTAGPGAWPVFELAVLSVPEGGGPDAIDVGQFATPQLIDLDDDGDLDLLVGEKNGTLTLFEQSSLGTWDLYVSPVHGENFGGIVVDNLLGINGYSVPAFTQTAEGIRAFVANETGTVQDFGLLTGNWDAALEEVQGSVFGDVHGYRAAAAFGRLDGDSLLDAVLGIQNGGLLAWVGGEGAVDVVDVRRPRPTWSLWPNPGTDVVRWETSSTWSGTLEVWNSQGQRVMDVPVRASNRGHVDMSRLPNGVYVVRPRSEFTGPNDKGAPAGAPLTWVKAGL